MQGKLIIITGPTASGKTSLAIQVASKLKCPIINADSRQVYKELSIGVAKPTQQELDTVPHYFINSHSIYEEPLNAAAFATQSMELLQTLWQMHPIVVMAGGTGFYIRALLHPLDHVSVPYSIRSQVQHIYKTQGLHAIVNQIEQINPQVIEQIETSNPARAQRALELLLSNQWHGFLGLAAQPNLNYKLFALDIPRPILYQNINNRVDLMIKMGLEHECKELVGKLPPELKTVGYTEFFDYFNGNYSYPQTIEKIKQHTRNYAKRQITYMKNQFKNIELLDNSDPEFTIFAAIKSWQ